MVLLTCMGKGCEPRATSPLPHLLPLPLHLSFPAGVGLPPALFVGVRRGPTDGTDGGELQGARI